MAQPSDILKEDRKPFSGMTEMLGQLFFIFFRVKSVEKRTRQLLRMNNAWVLSNSNLSLQ